MAKEANNQKYNELNYESYVHPFSHANYLYTIATLFDMKPAGFEKASVLEIGCAEGNNLAAMAFNYPEANFTGIDVSETQIAKAEALKEYLGIDNIDFECQDISDFRPKKRKDKYDYIICHGVFSWVSDDVRGKILEVCDKYLAANGVALISYNTLPGWNAVRSLRDMMIYHTKRFKTNVEKIAQAQFLLQFLHQNVSDNNVSYKSMIENELNLIKIGGASYLFHDHLEGENAQFYLSDFVNKVREFELDYVGDANIGTMFLGNMPQDAMEKLKAVNDVVSQEQYMDFIVNRRFRASIICKKGQKINRKLDKSKVLDYYLTFNPMIKVESKNPNEKVTFHFGDTFFETNEKISSTLFMELASQGAKPILATTLIKKVQQKLALEDTKLLESILVNNGLTLLLKGFMNIHSDTRNCAVEVSDKPEAYKLARFEAASNNYTRTKLSNVYDQSVSTDITTNIVVSNLDGTKSKEDLIEILLSKFEDGILKIQANDGKVLTKREDAQKVFVVLLDNLLPRLAERYFLVA